MPTALAPAPAPASTPASNGNGHAAHDSPAPNANANGGSGTKLTTGGQAADPSRYWIEPYVPNQGEPFEVSSVGCGGCGGCGGECWYHTAAAGGRRLASPGVG